MFHVKQPKQTPPNGVSNHAEADAGADAELDAALEVAQRAARAAGAIIRSRWDTPITIEHKGEVDLVTEVDRAAEAAIIAVLQAAYPADRIVAEEGGGGSDELADTGSARTARTWYVDPLDGTTNFSHGVPHFCVSIALSVGGDPVVGVVYEPIRDWMFHARRGGGAFRDATPLRVSQCAALSDALLATGFPYDRRATARNNTAEFARLLAIARGMRRAGAAALDLAYVAAGWLDGYWESRLKAWDIAAGTLLVREAGGRVTGMYSEALDLTAGHITAAPPALHDQLALELRALRASDK